MALSPQALTSLAAVKDYLRLTSADNDSLLESLIEAISAHFAAHTGRALKARDYSPNPASPAFDPDNAILDGSGYPELLLPQYPVQALTSLVMDGVALVPAQAPGQAGWVLDRAAGVLGLVGGVFVRGRHNLAVTYRAGFEAVPADLAQACLEQVAMRFQESGAGQGRLGVSARTLADGSVSYQGQALLPQVTAVLDRYRNRSLL
ncbi:MAG: phage gp6-like head-tail connector protein [Desulfarculus sp.]|nr:phage gp6-like head-tail connector protein [Desulfarculus sp.]